MDTTRHRTPDNPLYALAATSTTDYSSTAYSSTEPGFFRLIELSPGQWNDEILCTLKHYNRLRDGYPPYKALSYVWGRGRRNRPEILVNGYNVKVTANLETALKHLREQEKNVTLWIDALCIDQSNTEERSTQVAQMREIYSMASEVIIFLGNGLDYSKQHSKSSGDLRPLKRFVVGTVDASAAIDAWKASPLKAPVQAYEIFSFLTVVAQCSSCSDLFEFLEDIPQDHLTQLSEALRRTLLVSWWDRIWVVQEAVVAEKLTVRYGNVEISWELLVEVATVLHHWESSFADHPSYISTSDLKVFNLFSRVSNLDHFRQNWRKSQGTDLLSLMRYFGHRKASDDRDRVYALLGLCNQTTAIRPDYRLEVMEVFMAPIIETIRNTKSLSVLYGDHSRKTRRDLPSWVPDWSTELDENQRQRAALSTLFDASKGVTPILITDTRESSKHEFIKQEMTILLESLKVEVDPRSLLREELAPKLRGLETESRSPIIQDIKRLCEGLAHYCHKDGLRDLPKYGFIHHSGHSLTLHGIKVATVSKTTEPLYASSDRYSIVKVLDRWCVEALTRPYGQDHNDSHEKSCETFRERFLKTIMCDTVNYTGTSLERLHTEDTKALMWWLNNTIGRYFKDEYNDSPQIHIYTRFGHFGHFTEVIRLSATNRTFFFVNDVDNFYLALQRLFDNQDKFFAQYRDLLDGKVGSEGLSELILDYNRLLHSNQLWSTNNFVQHSPKCAISESAVLSKLIEIYEKLINRFHYIKVALDSILFPDECRKVINENRAFINEQKESFENIMHFPSYTSALFSKYGHMGLGPMLMKEGDEIYILPGSRLPLVLRPVSCCDSKDFLKPTRRYQLVGDCFLHGVMDGELGSIGGNILDYFDYLNKLSSKYWKSFDHGQSFLQQLVDEYLKSSRSEAFEEWRSSGEGTSFAASRYFVSPADYDDEVLHSGKAEVGDLVALEIV